MSVKWRGILTGCPAVYYWEERTPNSAGGLLLVCFSKKLRLCVHGLTPFLVVLPLVPVSAVVSKRPPHT